MAFGFLSGLAASIALPVRASTGRRALARHLDAAGLEILPAGGGAAIVAQSAYRHLPAVERHPLRDGAYPTEAAAWDAIRTYIRRTGGL